jgi:predicted nucleotidyltransferase
MFNHDKMALNQIAGLLKEKFSDRIEYIYAFGSRVRGDYGDGSDFDVLIVVKDKTPDIERRIIGLIVDAEESMNMSFTPVIKDAASFAREREINSPFYQNIINEGVRL